MLTISQSLCDANASLTTSSLGLPYLATETGLTSTTNLASLQADGSSSSIWVDTDSASTSVAGSSPPPPVPTRHPLHHLRSDPGSFFDLPSRSTDAYAMSDHETSTIHSNSSRPSNTNSSSRLRTPDVSAPAPSFPHSSHNKAKCQHVPGEEPCGLPPSSTSQQNTPPSTQSNDDFYRPPVTSLANIITRIDDDLHALEYTNENLRVCISEKESRYNNLVHVRECLQETLSERQSEVRRLRERVAVHAK